MSIQNLTTENFKTTICESDKTILVDFYADWCMPCKMIAPILDEISEENEDVLVFKVNIDENPELASEYSVKSIPNLISFKNGEVYKKALGAQPKDSILELVK